MKAIDTLIVARTSCRCAAAAVLGDHAVAIDGGRIVAVLPRARALARYDAPQVVRLERHALIPGS
jgi:5-methylthioadenosine/S-adenosylhomocysteine deaminase